MEADEFQLGRPFGRIVTEYILRELLCSLRGFNWAGLSAG